MTLGSSYILKLTNEINYPTDTYKEFKSIVSEIEDLYPGIDKWFNKKVIPGISEGSRYAFLVMHQGKAIAETIIKPGQHSKLCSMKIKSSFQNQSLGPILFAEIAKTLENFSETIHFTAPESLVYEREGLFKRLGFICEGRSNKIYRKGEDEFVFKASVSDFKKRALYLLNDSLNNTNIKKHQNCPIIMSIRAEHAYHIVKKRKTVEIRKRFSNNTLGSTIFIYATKPTGSVIGEAKIYDIKEGNPIDIWNNYHDKIGCTYEQYQNYCGNQTNIKAIILDEVIEYSTPLPWVLFSTTFNAPKRPPQSYEFFKPTGFTQNLNQKLEDDPQLYIPFLSSY